jgi:hypothetical protein
VWTLDTSLHCSLPRQSISHPNKNPWGANIHVLKQGDALFSTTRFALLSRASQSSISHLWHQLHPGGCITKNLGLNEEEVVLPEPDIRAKVVDPQPVCCPSRYRADSTGASISKFGCESAYSLWFQRRLKFAFANRRVTASFRRICYQATGFPSNRAQGYPANQHIKRKLGLEESSVFSCVHQISYPQGTVL